MPNEPLLSMVITSYTRERFRDICDLKWASGVWLAKVYLPDAGRTLNEELIKKGLAKPVEEHAGGG